MRIPLEWLKEYLDLGKLSPKEIGDAFTQIGLMTDKPFDGKVFDLEHRFDRSDWLSVLGCARDLAAYLKLDLKLPKTHKQEGKKPSHDQIVDIQVECPDTVNRFNTRVFRNVKVKPSPDWLRNRLEEYGIPSINNIVDVTNYVMVELGQPMHAQDLAKFKKQEVVIRHAKEGEKITTFLGEQLSLPAEAFVLTQKGTATVLGGIVGGRETGVDKKTTDIVLDAGNYNQNVIRKVSRKLKVQNETVLRYDKFLHPELTQHAIERATYLVLELAGGEYYQNIDWNPMEFKPKEMILRTSRVQKLAGFEISYIEIEDILTRLGYQIQKKNFEVFNLTVPYFRTDIEVEDDIVSDILRINGYSKIPTAQIQSAPPKDITPEIYNFEETLRDALVQLGAHEHITDPLISRNGNESLSPVGLENSQNANKDALRTSIRQTLKEVIPNYTKNQINSGVLFEIGMIYTQEGNRSDYQTYRETKVLECLLFDTQASPKDLHIKTSSILGGLMQNIGFSDFSLQNDKTDQAVISKDGVTLGSVRYDGFTLFTERLVTLPRQSNRVLYDVRSENSIETSLVIAKDYPVGKIIDSLRTGSPDITKVQFLEEYTGDKLSKNNRSILLRTYFKPEIKQSDGTETVKRILGKAVI